MPRITVNLTEVDISMPRFPVGIFTLEAVEATYEPDRAKKDGSPLPPCICIKWMEADAPDNKARIFDRFDVSGEHRWKLKGMLKFAGKDCEVEEIDTDDLAGITVRASITEDRTVNKETEEVTLYSNVRKYLKPEA